MNGFNKILKLDILPSLYLLIDALDECSTGLDALLNLIESCKTHRKVRWLVSSRNDASIHEVFGFDPTGVRTSLEVNSAHVLAAVRHFVHTKVETLSQRKRYSSDLKAEVRNHLTLNANDTFLWVALVCKELYKQRAGKAKEALTFFPSGLEDLYQRMLTQVDEHENTEDATLCRQLLQSVAVAIEPQKLSTLPALSYFPENMRDNVQTTRELVERCGSFLSVRGDTVHFVHQSAADFFCTGAGTRIFTDGLEGQHRRVTGLCIDWMTTTLKKDLCDLCLPGARVRDIDGSELQRVLPEWVQYACCHWVKHAKKGEFLEATAKPDGKTAIHDFLQTHLLHWLEALALQGRLSEALLGLAYIEAIAQELGHDAFHEFLVDARRFTATNRHIVETAPLQVYGSALVFSPQESSTRRQFAKDMPAWLNRLPLVPEGWGACRSIFEGHSDRVNTVVFSPDGTLVASASDDNTVRLWDAALGEARGTLEGHSGSVNTVVFSPDGTLVASGSNDKMVRLWDAASCEARGTLEGHLDWVTTVVFSPDGKLLFANDRAWSVQDIDTSNAQSRRPLPSHGPVSTAHRCSVDESQQWITVDDIRILWLPPDVRPGAFAVRDGTIVVGNGSGRVTLIHIDLGALDMTCLAT